MSIFPYIYYMISSFEITKDDRQIAIYAGMVTSAFTFAEFSTGVLWGRLSDKIGRKPVLITGLLGTGISMIIFGFARSLPVAMLARALGGFLNGNIGVLQTTVAEMITEKEHQPRAYAIMPFIWCLGSILGPALGGALAEPCTSYPSVFHRGSIFDKFPYLLPNLVCTVVVMFGVGVGILFLEETHDEKKHRRDMGREAGRWIWAHFGGRFCQASSDHSKASEASIEETRQLLEDDEPPPGYRTADGSPRLHCSKAGGPETEELPDLEGMMAARKPPPVTKAFTKQVVLNIVGYGILAYHTITFEQLLPVLLSSPETHDPASLPFKFTGGLALPTKTIGLIMSFQGIYSMIAQVLLFPVIVRRFGSLAVFRFVAFLYPLLYFIVPYVTLLPGRLQMIGIYFCLVLKVTLAVLAYPSNAILLTNSAPSTLVLGAINGIAASTASLSRGFGPTVSGFIHALGLKWGYSGLAWWASAFVGVLGAMQCLWMAEDENRLNMVDNTNEVVDSGIEPIPEDGVDVPNTTSMALAGDRQPTGYGSLGRGALKPQSRRSSSMDI
ncbi:MAG: hypothetical protein M4579_000812 [Chaenotheca gracillima]|nr:MAG: hypothetical protein M4579_000812 [Chaenotheca gracillima]